MKKYAPLLIIAVLIAANFGLALMSHMDELGHGCPFEAAGATNCVLSQTPMDFVTSHLNALAKFSSATVVVSVLSAVLLFAFSLFFKLYYDPGLFKLRPLLVGNLPRGSYISPYRRKLTHWLSIHENSPSTL